MARPLRVEFENGLFHVTTRGWERRVIVDDDQDREAWLQLLDRERRHRDAQWHQLLQQLETELTAIAPEGRRP